MRREATALRFRAAIVMLLAACSPATSRPAFPPVPEARIGEVELEVPQATERLARELTAAGIPVNRVAPRDGYLETAWFDTATGKAVGARTSGGDRVRVRGWVRPSRHGYSELTVETVYRPFADPSAAPRELERSVPFAHPVRARVRAAFAALRALTAVEEPDAVPIASRRSPRVRPDSIRPPAADTAKAAADSAAALAALASRADTGATPDSARGRPDTARARTDSARARPDTARARPDTTRARSDTTRVRADTARPPEPAPARAGYSVQVAASTDRDVADLAAGRLRELGLGARVVREGSLFKVRTAAYPSEASAEPILRRLRRVFPDAFLVRP